MMNWIQIKCVLFFFFLLSIIWYKKIGNFSNELEKLVEITLKKPKKNKNSKIVLDEKSDKQTLLKKIHLPKYITTHMLFLPSEVSVVLILPLHSSSFFKSYLTFLSFKPLFVFSPHLTFLSLKPLFVFSSQLFLHIWLDKWWRPLPQQILSLLLHWASKGTWVHIQSSFWNGSHAH